MTYEQLQYLLKFANINQGERAEFVSTNLKFIS